MSFVLFSFLTFSCEKEKLGNNSKLIDNKNQSLIKNNLAGKHFGKITDKNIDNLHKKVSEFSIILKEMYGEELVFDQVNNSIALGVYSDENILLDDLLNPDKSILFKNSRASINYFRNKYDEIIEKTNSKNARPTNDKDKDYLIANGVSIYFPYSENFKNNKLKEITIVMPPKEDTDEAEGIKLEKCGNKDCETIVKVNDNYAMKNPTHVIYAGGAKVKENYIKEIKKAKVSAVNQVYLGAIKCKKQYDALISFTGNGNGSEIKVFRGSAYLVSNTVGQISAPIGDGISLYFTRSQINNCNYQVINASWDIDWKVDNLEQVFGVYEEDTQGTKTFTGSLNTTLKVGGQNQNGTLGYNISVQTQDEIIRNWKISRAAFYVANGINQGYGTYVTVGGLTGGPWAVWDGAINFNDCTGANVGYILPTITN